MSDYFERKAQYAAKRAEIQVDAYNELIELVGKLGNRRLKDQMWALVHRAIAQQNAAFEESRPSCEGATR